MLSGKKLYKKSVGPKRTELISFVNCTQVLNYYRVPEYFPLSKLIHLKQFINKFPVSI